MLYSNIHSSQQQQQQHQKNSLLLTDEEANMLNFNDKLLLPSSTRSLKRRTSLLEKSRDWARRLITLHRPRRNTISNEKFHDTYSEFTKTPSKNFDEDGYLSPLEIKAQLDNNNQTQSSTIIQNRNIYRYYDPNIQRKKRYPTTSFVSEFQKSLSIVDYIDVDMPDDLTKQDDDPLESLKYLFNPNHRHNQNIIRRIPRRPTNASSISTDSGYSDIPTLSSNSSPPSSSKIIPVNLISCSLIPVNIRCLTCTCHRPSSTTCLINNEKLERKFYSHSSRSPLLNNNHIENGIRKSCICQNKSHSTMTIATNTDEQCQQKKSLRRKRINLLKHPTITDDLISISRWYKPYLERESVCTVLQQADYGAFILRNSTTHSNCYALSIKVPKFTHDSNIVHYLIEKTYINNNITTPSYRIKGTLKQFPTLLSLITHHSVMPEILPITLNLNESFTI